MHFGSTMAGQTMRYIVPIYLSQPFTNYILQMGLRYQHTGYIVGSAFFVVGSAEQQRKLQEFVKELRRERRTLLISNWNVDKVAAEVEMWGMKLEKVRRGIIFTRATIVGETIVLDRLEKHLNSNYML